MSGLSETIKDNVNISKDHCFGYLQDNKLDKQKQANTDYLLFVCITRQFFLKVIDISLPASLSRMIPWTEHPYQSYPDLIIPVQVV